jgi:nitroimidazol reductase NimA-like FMN-containing flavoprotein (pyridoxamine 5'-phosphate oxidase superfamily)
MKSLFKKDEKEFFEKQKVLRFSSITPKGEAHSVPLCFAFDGKNFFFHRRRAGRKRRRNLEKNNKASLELDVYTDDWSGNAGLLIYGTTRFVDSGPERDTGLSLLRKRYPQYRGKDVLPDSTSMVVFEPSRVTSWHH